MSRPAPGIGPTDAPPADVPLVDARWLDARLSDPDAAAVVAQARARAAAAGQVARHLAGIAEARTRARIGRPPAPRSDPAVFLIDYTLVGPGGPLPVRCYRPRHGREAATVVYLHGGGWALGDLDINDGVCRVLADRGEVAIVSVDYRLAPEHPFPAALDDAQAVADLVASGRAAPPWPMGPLPTRLVVGGLSAGGALAAALARRCRDGVAPPAAHQVLFCPVLDCDLDRDSYTRYGDGLILSRDDMAWFWDLYAPDPAARNHPDASPLRAATLAGLPAATVVIAGADPLRDEAVAYARGLEDAGVAVRTLLVEGVPHGFVCMPAIASGAIALDAAADQLRAALSAPTDPTAPTAPTGRGHQHG
ncbi:Alpha/beta hydrolase fold-3 domain protein [Frankia canadensis]|uniref:Alpha/beta hydrolase fold-3 domain protein n=1 Tax=Frankia canadensis TaxID=1836972 RepID=A0A2I2KSN6_9ACTN|nr:alpha/beta hydrolase [Frankia canadensis]SNQ48688.1 Alpha/beta hydrolase fold-3 domain protein [Frankia canadensis]SOU55978.1 Alpha/beta hydrolase fold-3 domain protein [Frankia canadensis]